MADVMKKQIISYELAQKMANAAITKARKLGVTENAAILDDGGNLKPFCRMDGAPTRSSWQASPRLRASPRGVEGFPLR
jgi:uncharacterized protein GlcG (DUF336 family)